MSKISGRVRAAVRVGVMVMAHVPWNRARKLLLAAFAACARAVQPYSP
jgi:hypothetical protein